MRRALRVTMFALLAACRARDARLRPLPRVARVATPAALRGERVEAPWLRLETVRDLADHERGRVACQHDPRRHAVVCVTDLRTRDWHRKGVRLLRVDPARFTVEERLVAPHFHGSFLWGDFNEDGALDFWGFSDEFDDADARAALYLGTADPWVFTETRPVAITHPVLGGAVLDADGDGHEDVLILGTGTEFQPGRAPSYERDALYRGDGRGGFTLANARLGLDRAPDFVGHRGAAWLGRTAAVTDLDGDGRSDLVIGNYRAHPDSFLRSEAPGRFVPWAGAPDRDPRRAYFGHAVGLAPVDLAGAGRLDLVVFNLWHNDERGEVTDRSYVLRADGRRAPLAQPFTAPFGGVAADLDGDGAPEVLLATGRRSQPYHGQAVLLREGRVVWRDPRDWLQLRETPCVADLNLDGAPDIIGDGRVIAQRRDEGAAWIGFAFAGRSVSGATVLFEESSGARRAFSLAADGRGQPSNLLTVGLRGRSAPRRLVVHEAVGRTHELDLRDLETGRYHEIRLTRLSHAE